jgi:hypothetical protein
MSPIRTRQLANYWKIASQVILGTVRLGDATAHASHRRCLRRGCSKQFAFRVPSSRATVRRARAGDGAGSGKCTAITSACRRHRPMHASAVAHAVVNAFVLPAQLYTVTAMLIIQRPHARHSHASVPLGAARACCPSTLMLPLTLYTYTHTPVYTHLCIYIHLWQRRPPTQASIHTSKIAMPPREAPRLGRKACSCAHPATTSRRQCHLPSPIDSTGRSARNDAAVHDRTTEIWLPGQ